MRRHAHCTAGIWSLACHSKVMAYPPRGFLHPESVRLPMIATALVKVQRGRKADLRPIAEKRKQVRDELPLTYFLT